MDEKQMTFTAEFSPNSPTPVEQAMVKHKTAAELEALKKERLENGLFHREKFKAIPGVKNEVWFRRRQMYIGERGYIVLENFDAAHRIAKYSVGIGLRNVLGEGDSFFEERYFYNAVIPGRNYVEYVTQGPYGIIREQKEIPYILNEKDISFPYQPDKRVKWVEKWIRRSASQFFPDNDGFYSIEDKEAEYIFPGINQRVRLLIARREQRELANAASLAGNQPEAPKKSRRI